MHRVCLNGTAAAALAAAAIVGAGSFASADVPRAQKQVKTRTSVHHTCELSPCERRLGFPIVFNGRVKSDDDDCVGIRKVKLYELVDGTLRGKTVSDVDGTWEIEDPSGGFNKYRVIVRRKKVGNTTCLEGRKTDKVKMAPPR